MRVTEVLPGRLNRLVGLSCGFTSGHGSSCCAPVMLARDLLPGTFNTELARHHGMGNISSHTFFMPRDISLYSRLQSTHLSRAGGR